MERDSATESTPGGEAAIESTPGDEAATEFTPGDEAATESTPEGAAKRAILSNILSELAEVNKLIEQSQKKVQKMLRLFFLTRNQNLTVLFHFALLLLMLGGGAGAQSSAGGVADEWGWSKVGEEVRTRDEEGMLVDYIEGFIVFFELYIGMGNSGEYASVYGCMSACVPRYINS